MWCGQRPQLGGADIDKTKKAQKQKQTTFWLRPKIKQKAYGANKKAAKNKP
jgi:hypothetical protein